MSSEPHMVRLDSVAQINPRRKVSKGNSVPFIDMAALPQNSRDINYSDVVLREAKGAGAHFQNGDTLLARITPCLENGKTAQVRCLKTGDVGEGSTEFITLCGIDTADNDYVYYLCRDPVFREYAIGRMEGTSGRQRVSWQSIAAYEFICPRPLERRAAARALAALDDRITLLRETNATLEAIAQALFKSWFVDFDPVRAKLEGRAPEGMDEATAALFPDEFEESELGLVPGGWRVGTLQDLLLLQRGFDLPSDQRTPGDYPIIAASGPSGTHNVSMAKAPGVVTGRSGVLGRVFLELDDYWPLNTTLWVKEFRGATPCYAYELLSLLDLKSFNAGSAVPTLNRNHVHGLRYLVPPNACVTAYESIAIQLHERARLNDEQAQTLATLRDTLLPRLISGQLRLPDAVSV
jgi:type I restriction enzyme, S subunit